MLGQNSQAVEDLANDGPILGRVAGLTSGHDRRPGQALVGGQSSPVSDEPTHMLPGETARSHEIAMELEAAPCARESLAINVLVVDDCTLYRENLAVVLGVQDAFAARVAWDLSSLLATFERGTPDVVLLNMSTKDSRALLRTVTSRGPDVKVIALGVWESDEPTIVDCAEAGVAGYHLRSESLDDLLVLIGKVGKGETVCSPRVAAMLLRRLSALASECKPAPGQLILTAREIQILRMLQLGMSNREIANDLCIALHTVKNHVHSVLGKLGVSTRAQAVAVAGTTRYTQVGLGDLGLEPV